MITACFLLLYYLDELDDADSVKQPITGYHRDREGEWVAQLAGGHLQHVRHSPPWQNRPWVQTLPGRESMLGQELDCVKCDAGGRQDYPV